MDQEIAAFFDGVLTGVGVAGVLRGLAIRVKVARPDGSQSSQLWTGWCWLVDRLWSIT
jgi:hypothetical protein